MQVSAPQTVKSRRSYLPLSLPATLAIIVGVAAGGIPGMISERTSGIAADYHRYYIVTKFLLNGSNPYNRSSLQLIEYHLGWASSPHVSGDGFVLLPFILLLLIPLAAMPFAISYGIYTVVVIALTGTVIALAARALEWRFWYVVPLVSLLWWPDVWGRTVGQLDFFLLLGVLASCWLVSRHHYGWAGISLLTVWVQPELGWILVPALVLLLIGDGRAVRQALLMFSAGTLALCGLVTVVSHDVILRWFSAGGIFLSNEGAKETDLLGFSGLMQAVGPHAVNLYKADSIPVIVMALIGACLAAVIGAKLRAERSLLSNNHFEQHLWVMSFPLGVWTFVLPYGHPNNAIVLLPLVLLMLGTNANRALASSSIMASFGVFAILSEIFTGTILLTDLMPLAVLALLIGSALAVWGRQGPLQASRVLLIGR